ncbi:hypothetical protein WDW89_02855 [Deltaproteobacteria bacterium TL4]
MVKMLKYHKLVFIGLFLSLLVGSCQPATDENQIPGQTSNDTPASNETGNEISSDSSDKAPLPQSTTDPSSSNSNNHPVNGDNTNTSPQTGSSADASSDIEVTQYTLQKSGVSLGIMKIPGAQTALMGSDAEGGKLFLMSHDLNEGYEVILETPKGKTARFEFDKQSLPVSLTASGYYLTFSNYTGKTVELKITTPEGKIDYIEIPYILTNQRNDRVLEVEESIPTRLIRASAKAIGAVGCGLSVYGAVQTGGLLTPIAAYSCGGTLIGILADITDSQLLDKASTAVDVVTCAVGDIGGCASSVLNFTADAKDGIDAVIAMQKPKEAPLNPTIKICEPAEQETSLRYCSLDKGTGQQIRSCTSNETWGEWGECLLLVCDEFYFFG